jgi:DMSO/TMAO reductase YedYZ molybdopterin-dependent catalytic subunit
MDKIPGWINNDKLSRRTILKLGIAIGIGLAGVSAAGCISQGTPSSVPSPVGAVELTEYNGQKLDSVKSIRVNAIKGAQHIEADTYSIVITGLVNNPKTYSYNDIVNRASLKKVVTLHCVEGWDATALWEGVMVKDLLDEAGVKPGAKTVIFYAQDGDSSSFTMDDIQNQFFLLSYKINNIPLTAEHGYPSRLVAGEKWGYKWIKWITRIELSDQEYKGYWESRGYSNNGDLNKNFLA